MQRFIAFVCLYTAGCGAGGVSETEFNATATTTETNFATAIVVPEIEPNSIGPDLTLTPDLYFDGRTFRQGISVFTMAIVNHEFEGEAYREALDDTVVFRGAAVSVKTREPTWVEMYDGDNCPKHLLMRFRADLSGAPQSVSFDAPLVLGRMQIAKRLFFMVQSMDPSGIEIEVQEFDAEVVVVEHHRPVGCFGARVATLPLYHQLP